MVSITHIISATNQIAGLNFLSSAISSYCLLFDLQLLNKFLFLFSLEFEFKVEGNTIGGQATALNRNVKFQEKILKIDTTVESHHATLTFLCSAKTKEKPGMIPREALTVSIAPLQLLKKISNRFNRIELIIMR